MAVAVSPEIEATLLLRTLFPNGVRQAQVRGPVYSGREGARIWLERVKAGKAFTLNIPPDQPVETDQGYLDHTLHSAHAVAIEHHEGHDSIAKIGNGYQPSIKVTLRAILA